MLTPKQTAKIEALAVKDAEIEVGEMFEKGDDLSKFTPGQYGQEEADEGLINELGAEGVAKYFGVVAYDADGSLSDDYREACQAYSRAYRDAVEFEKQEYAEGGVMRFTTRRDAEDFVEDRLGSEGTRALAVIFCTLTRWQTVDQLTEKEWAEILDKAMAREAVKS